MKRDFPRICALLAVIATLPAASLAGCGGSSSQIEVRTGTLTRADFAKRVNTFCEGVRRSFLHDFQLYFREHPTKNASHGEWLKGVYEAVIVPDYGERMIHGLSVIGVPASEKAKVVDFLESLQSRIDELGEKPEELNETPFPFASIEKLAARYGLKGCAHSFS